MVTEDKHRFLEDGGTTVQQFDKTDMSSLKKDLYLMSGRTIFHFKDLLKTVNSFRQ